MIARDGKPAIEDTDAGPQTLMRAVAPITQRDRLAVLAAAPMAPRAAQNRCDHGLFDLNSRRQTDLIDELRHRNRKPQPSTKEKE